LSYFSFYLSDFFLPFSLLPSFLWVNPDKGELLLGQEHRPRRPKCLRPFDPAMDGAGFVLQL
jgi:hypothetical protein